ncbi:hypothetical protein ASPCAL07339 [Aspergillus calidoustus]|uniref:Uncharacterized protein n=1 Tax=Aspergillus calidoustus TaxID=454130 RepID=A0A0U5G7D9_ASPCI|nr:hypothetical protein ASPCAL07339 [Aspergillus calidoustus]
MNACGYEGAAEKRWREKEWWWRDSSGGGERVVEERSEKSAPLKEALFAVMGSSGDAREWKGIQEPQSHSPSRRQ